MNTVPQSSEQHRRHRAVPEPLRALLESLIDYAGLFPPAALDLRSAVSNYARYLDSQHSWMLARFVVPAGSLSEFQAEQARLLSEPTTVGASPARQSEWKLSVLLGPNPAADIEQIAEFHLHNRGRARVDSVEARVTTEPQVRHIATLLPAGATAYFEIAPDCPDGLLHAIRDVGGRAKIRTGGVTPDAIPPSSAVAAFLTKCAHLKVPFKATAGLHHPLCCVKPLTYEANAPEATMHGFLNVFLAAVLAYTSPSPVPAVAASSALLDLLNATAPMLQFTDNSLALPMAHGPVHIEAADIRRGRREFAISFGSCSFAEPVSDLRELKLL